MMRKPRIVTVITARSGSKGLPDKNIRQLCGKPMLAYSIEAAIISGVSDFILVSTDSPQYAQIARAYGALVPFMRSSVASSDTASSWDVLKEVVAHLSDIGERFDAVLLLQPTSPLRSAADIQEAVSLFVEKKANAVVSVCESEHPPQWFGLLDSSLSLEGFLDSRFAELRRQDLPKYYRMNGAVYIVDIDFLMDMVGICVPGCYAYVMPISRSVDVDTLEDFAYAEYILNYYCAKERGK